MKSKPFLLNTFKPATEEEWRAATDQLLKGKPFDRWMKELTPEGIELESIYWKDALEETQAPKTLPGYDGYLRGTQIAGTKGQRWQIAQDLAIGSPEAFNRAAREAIQGGQDALRITLDLATLRGIDPPDAHPGEVGLCGLSLSTRQDCATAFEGIDPTVIPIHLSTRSSSLGLAALFFNWLKEAGYSLESVKGSFAADPIADLASLGRLPTDLESLFNEQYALTDFCLRQTPDFQAIGVSTLPYHLAGASAVDELATALATGRFYLQAMITRGLSINQVAPQIRFTLSIGPNFFMEIAKFRAIRVLWSQLVEAYGGNGDAQKIKIHARTGLYNKTQIDPQVNMLRTSTEALSAAIAGVDSMCVGHFDEVLGTSSAFSQRIARNSQIILQEECGLSTVSDPAGGSWAIESLTHKLGERSWARFQAIEAEGGIIDSLRKGSIRESLAETASIKEKEFQYRRRGLVGTNLYPNTSEFKPPSQTKASEAALAARIKTHNRDRAQRSSEAIRRLAEILGHKACSDYPSVFKECMKAARAGATLGEISRAVRSEVQSEHPIQPLPKKRLAEAYEEILRKVAEYKTREGKRPTIGLLNLGKIPLHKARAEFSTAFFAAAGFHIEASPPLSNIDAVLSTLEKIEANIFVVCGHDDDYLEYFPTYARAIKSVQPEVKLVLAGFPGEHEQRFRAAGMDDFIFIKSNPLAINQAYLTELGIL